MGPPEIKADDTRNAANTDEKSPATVNIRNINGTILDGVLVN
jgi:hypothetical protein